MISKKFNDPTLKLIHKKIVPKTISYEIICAEERNAPKNAYFELLAHPPKIIP
jgi:hypothetical protein